MTHTQERAPAAAPPSVRQLAVLACGIVAALGLAAGVGAFGGPPVGEAAGGDLSASATLVAPAGPAFTIWTPIYLGLVAFAGWQVMPARRSAPRVRRVDLPLGVSMVANALWILAAQAGALALSVALIVVILVALVVAYGRLLRDAPRTRLEAILLDGTTGLYLGWVTVATVANVVAALSGTELEGLPPGRTAWSAAVLLVAAAVGVAVTWRGAGRLAYPVAVTWGLAWVAVARTAGSPPSVAVAVVAALGAVAVAAATLLARRR